MTDQLDPTGINATGVDVDGDGERDLTAFDLDNDGLSDAISTLDENGVTAWVNADGHPGWDLVFRDFDVDGAVDATMADLDQDGFFEKLQLADGTVFTLDPATGMVVSAEGPSAPALEPATEPVEEPVEEPEWAQNIQIGAPVDQEVPEADPVANQDPAQSPLQVPPEAQQPQNQSPIPNQPGAPGYQPEAQQPEAQQPQEQNPFPDQPGAPGYQPEAQQPEAQQPQEQNPFPDQPGTPGYQPEAQQPEAQQPQEQNPFPDQPGTPGYQPEAQQPEAQQPQEQNPFPDQPGTPGYQPEAQQPEAQQPQEPQRQEQSPIPDQPGAPGYVPVEEPGSQEPQVIESNVVPRIYGDYGPEAWTSQYQSENGLCGPASIAMVVSEYLGRFVTENETVATALDLNAIKYAPGSEFGNWSGMTVNQVEATLEAYGIPAHVEGSADETPGQALDRLRGELADNKGVILMVDGHEVWWRGSGDDEGDVTRVSDGQVVAPRDSGQGLNHLLLIREINDIDGTVTLSDPGNKDGGKEWVMSQQDFIEAWDDEDPSSHIRFLSVVTDAPPAAQAAAQPADPDSIGLPTATVSEPAEGGRLVGSRVAAATGWVILPVVLAGAVLADRMKVRPAEVAR